MATSSISASRAPLLPLPSAAPKTLKPTPGLGAVSRPTGAAKLLPLAGRPAEGGLRTLEPAPAGSRREAEEAVKAFEAVFLRTLASAMTASVGKGESAGGMKGGAFYQGLIDEQFGRLLAEDGGMGKGLEQALMRVMLPAEGVDGNAER